MLSRRESEQVLFGKAQPLAKRLPLSYYRHTEIMPCTLANSHEVVNRIVWELREEERHAADADTL